MVYYCEIFVFFVPADWYTSVFVCVPDVDSTFKWKYVFGILIVHVNNGNKWTVLPVTEQAPFLK